MTTYRDPNIRGIVLHQLGIVRGDVSERYAQIVGTLTALLDDDKEMVDAINAACRRPQEKSGD